MERIGELCQPRESVFVDTARDDVLNLSDFIEGRIEADKFFDENFQTAGMRLLFSTAFDRFAGKSATGVIRLTQAMGGGKTHNMLALALLAQNPALRSKLFGGNRYADLPEIKVIAFSGRESDAEFGIWSSLAEQLGKKEKFAAYYSPLRAPGESAWINLLKDQRILILLDELPPYLENARSIQVGNSDLCQVTVTALSNLFSALGKEQLANVCLVFSDLKAAYESGSDMLRKSYKELENEANRIALNIEPVALNSDEVYDILRKRLFSACPQLNSASVNSIANLFKTAVESAGKSGLTNYSPEKIYLGVRDSYPFHPSIKELYARFKENQGFQQTRGLIRLMRQIVRQFYESGKANNSYLINVFDFDLNNDQMLTMVKAIKPSLDNAISHDIAQHGKAVAEVIDASYADEYPIDYSQRLAKLLLVSSLNDTLRGLNGLTESEIIGYLCEPNADMNQYKRVLDDIVAQCWYLKQDNRGRYYFQNTKNMVAEMNGLIDGYSNEFARKELRKYLEEKFKPSLQNCYRLLYVMPAVDEIKLEADKVALIIYEPYSGSGLHPDLQRLYDNALYRNRVMFLTGQKSMMAKLFENSKRLAAIRQIINNMKAEHISELDQQYREACDQETKALAALLSTIKETFITLYYPSKNGLTSDDFKLVYLNNDFKGEEQIVNTLADAQKFEDYSSEDKFLETLRKKCEQRIFTQQEMTWKQILDRAASETGWQWYHPSQMEQLKKVCISHDNWREVGGYLKKGPFAKEPTSVLVEQKGYDETTGEFTLQVRGQYGTHVYWDVGAPPSEASAEVSYPFVTKETSIWFLCVDGSSDNPHPTGEPLHFYCQVPLKYEQRRSPEGYDIMELKTHKDFTVRYTTDGSNPKESGGIYNGEFVLPDNCKCVRTVVYNYDYQLQEKDIEVSECPDNSRRAIDNDKPVNYTLKKAMKCTDTEADYREFDLLQQSQVTSLSGFSICINEKGNGNNYLEINGQIRCSPAELQKTVDFIRESALADKEVIIEFSYRNLYFATGKDFKRWINSKKLDMYDVEKNGEIKQ